MMKKLKWFPGWRRRFSYAKEICGYSARNNDKMEIWRLMRKILDEITPARRFGSLHNATYAGAMFDACGDGQRRPGDLGDAPHDDESAEHWLRVWKSCSAACSLQMKELGYSRDDHATDNA